MQAYSLVRKNFYCRLTMIWKRFNQKCISIADRDAHKKSEKMHYAFNYGSLQPCLKLFLVHTSRMMPYLCHTEKPMSTTEYDSQNVSLHISVR